MNTDKTEVKVIKAEINTVNEVDIRATVRLIGMQPHLLGYRYTVTAVMLLLENPELIDAVVKELYTAVAKTYGTTGSRVERSIRHSIDLISRIPLTAKAYEVFTSCINERGEFNKPAVSAFLANITEYLKYDYKS